MAQVSIYITPGTQKRLQQAARKAKKSVSQLVQEAVDAYIVSAWPRDYEQVLGSLNDFERPEQPRLSDDVPRLKF